MNFLLDKGEKFLNNLNKQVNDICNFSSSNNNAKHIEDQSNA